MLTPSIFFKAARITSYNVCYTKLLRLKLPVGGAFHSPLMEPAREELAAAIEATKFNAPICPVYQNVNAQAVTDPATIKENLVAQLTAPVKWTQTVQNMIADGVTSFTEVGPGNRNNFV